MEMPEVFFNLGPSKISVGISIEKLWEQGGNIIKKFPQFKCLPTTQTPHYVRNTHDTIKAMKYATQTQKVFHDIAKIQSVFEDMSSPFHPKTKKQPEHLISSSPKMQSVFDNKVEFIDDLNNDKQLYKTHGFSRKRTLTIQQLQEDIRNEIPTTHVLTYISKICCISVLYVDPINIHIELIEYEQNANVKVIISDKNQLFVFGVVSRSSLKEYVETNWNTIPTSKLKKLIHKLA
jgi:hypothetical protein